MKALIDLDALVYQYGGMSFEDGAQMPRSMVEKLVDKKVEEICDSAKCDTWKGFLTFGPDNFRIQLATIKKYKGNRDGVEKPVHYEHIRGYLMSKTNVHMAMGCEADDLLGIDQWKDRENTVICTIDKDLKMIPGYHYAWARGDVKEVPLWEQGPEDADVFFFRQCLTGDPVDNIPGLFGVGPKSSYLHRVDRDSSPLDMVAVVQEMYEKYYGSYAHQFLTEVGNLLWIQRNPGETFQEHYKLWSEI